MSKRLLLIFGLRGTLLERIHSSKAPLTAPQLAVGLHKVWLRPGLHETLANLSTDCDIAIWSSTTARNTHPLIDAVFKETVFPFKFVWTREHTSNDDFRRLTATVHEDEHATLKDLERVIQAFPECSLDRLVLIDDTPSKARLNADNFLWLEPFGEASFESDTGLPKLCEFVKTKLTSSADVRKILPQRI